MALPPILTTHRITREYLNAFASDVRRGLCREGQKELPSQYLYDEIGSALFDAICLLPEYGLSRAGARLIERHARDIVTMLRRPVVIAELGSGSGRKTRRLLEEVARFQPVHYYPIDISGAALARCRQELAELESVSVVGFERAFIDGLVEVVARRQPGEHLLVLFLGSTIGNFTREGGEGFLAEVRRTLQPGDALLLATDLEKSISQLLAAYDDPAGVTAAFNKNLLARINRELGGDFALDQFAHEARWNAENRRIEMHVRSLRRQRVCIPAAEVEVEFQADETIWTESSHRYDPGEVAALGARTGYRCLSQWTDEEWPFAQSLFFAI